LFPPFKDPHFNQLQAIIHLLLEEDYTKHKYKSGVDVDFLNIKTGGKVT
jgi:hypothetical protein